VLSLKENAPFPATFCRRDYNHMSWRGAFDASVGFMRASIRRSVESQSNALLLLAMNKRLARLEEELQPPAPSSAPSPPFQLGAVRPDACAPYYSSFELTALNAISVRESFEGTHAVGYKTVGLVAPRRNTGTWMAVGHPPYS
jgi:hypothetical protein